LKSYWIKGGKRMAPGLSEKAYQYYLTNIENLLKKYKRLSAREISKLLQKHAPSNKYAPYVMRIQYFLRLLEKQGKVKKEYSNRAKCYIYIWNEKE